MTPSERSTVRRRPHPLLAPGGVFIMAAAVASFIGTVDPNEPGHYPTCPFLALTGLYCPGCGSLRMIHALVGGHVAEAAGRNLFAFAMLPLLGFFWMRWTFALARGRPTRTKAGDPRLIWALFFAIMIFWIVRNLPFGAVLAP